MTGSPAIPSNQEGWGLLRLDNAPVLPGQPAQPRASGTRATPTASLTGESRTHHVDVATNTQPLRVTLRLDRAAGRGRAAPHRSSTISTSSVISPDGSQTFLGNVFAGGVSTTGGAADR